MVNEVAKRRVEARKVKLRTHLRALSVPFDFPSPRVYTHVSLYIHRLMANKYTIDERKDER
jgi:hypothetical protein